jgi:tetratricopeptide (TPR) repeat protein
LFFSFRSHSGAASRLDASDVLIDALAAISPGPAHGNLGADQLSVHWRTDTSGRRILVVLDDIVDAAQVSSLMPNSHDCTVIITSRQIVPGIDPDVHVELGGLSTEEAQAMITGITRRVSLLVDDSVIRSLARVYRLPLSLRHIADQLVSGPESGMNIPVDQQSDPGDPTAAFRATIRTLTTAEQLVFRRVALYPGAHVTATTAGALADLPSEDADAALIELHNHGLIGKPDPHGYAFHDLVRSVALEYSHTNDTEADRTDAHERLFEQTADTLDELNALINALPMNDNARRPPGVTVNSQDEFEAFVWLGNYFEDLRAVTRLAINDEWPRTWILSSGLSYFMRIRRNIPQAIELNESALQIALTSDDDLGRAASCLEIGILERALSNYVSAQEHVRVALAIFVTRNDLLGQAACHLELGYICHHLTLYIDARNNSAKAFTFFKQTQNVRGIADSQGALGMINRLLGEHQAARAYLEQALIIFTEIGNVRSRAWILIELGTVDRQTGNYGQASERFVEARDLFKRADDRNGCAWAERELGIVLRVTGDHVSAEPILSRALEVFTSSGSKRNVADASVELAALHRSTGELVVAQQEATMALKIYQDIGNIRGAAWTEIELGVIERLQGDLRAPRRFERALLIYKEIGDKSGLARTYLELGIVSAAERNTETARERLSAALSLYEAIGSPESDDVRVRLAAL